MSGFVQVLDPLGGVAFSALVALLPLLVLLVALAGMRLPAWVVVVIAAGATVFLAVLVWRAPLGGSLAAYGVGAATGLWSVSWIVFWGVVVYHTLVATGAFDALRRWLLERAGADIRVQTMMVAWAFGALLEGLVGFGYPWAVVAPILATFGLGRIAAIRVAALANNAPVSFGALGAPVIALAAVTGLPTDALSASIGQLTAVLAVAPPFLLIYLVSGWRGLREGWPLALVAAGGYIVGQLPTSQFVGPYLPDVIGALTSFAGLWLLLRVWTPSITRGYGGAEIATHTRASDTGTTGGSGASEAAAPGGAVGAALFTPPSGLELGAGADTWDERPAEPMRHGRHAAVTDATDLVSKRRSAAGNPAARGLVPLGILVVVVLAWTGPWSPLPGITVFSAKLSAAGSLGGTVSASFSWTPFVAGTAILVAWVGICAYLRPSRGQLGSAFAETGRQMWVALLVAPLLFGLATVFNYAGLANSMARGFAGLGPVFVLLAPVLGWVAVALSGSNTSANTIFGAFQLSVGRLLGAPLVLFPALNSVGAEIGKPVAPQTVSVGVATTGLTGQEGQVIRNHTPWTLALLAYLMLIGVAFYTWSS